MSNIKMTVHTPQFSKGEEARDRLLILVGWLLVLLVLLINPNLSFPLFERNE